MSTFSELLGEDVALLVDACIFGVAALAAIFCIVGCFYIIPYRCCANWMCGCCAWKESMQEFNSLWPIRLFMLNTTALLMVVHVLPLGALWSPNSWLPIHQLFAIDPEDITLMCRIFLVAALGFAEPLLLLTALFACRANNLKKTNSPKQNPSLNIVLLATVSTVPMLLAQGAVAFATIYFDEVEFQDDQLWHYFLSVSDERTNSPTCSAAEVAEDTATDPFGTTCVACLYPASSTIVSVIFTFIYLLSLWSIFDSIAHAVLNRVLRKRLRVLQGIVTVALILGVALRGVGIVAGPDDTVFVVIRLGYFLTVVVYSQAICWTLIWWPILDARRADWQADLYLKLDNARSTDESQEHEEADELIEERASTAM